jgi:MYXO-CTERM domain-containing protein
MASARYVLPSLALGLLVPASAQGAEWGSFDASRINYAAGVLPTGSDHDGLRGIIAAAGDTLAAGTAVIDAAYLSGVDVFYTSLPSNVDPPLSMAEQTALQAWIAGGGTLIVTADANPLPTYESFTQPYGVTGYLVSVGAMTATTVGMHPLTAGVASIDPALQVTFGHGPDAQEIAVDDLGQTFMVVLDESTGFCSGGQILVVGDHNLFTDLYIGNVDNMLLATNMVQWAGNPTGGCSCGDGALDPGEACEDGNMDDTDACVACMPASCGDGHVWAGMEACDDANLDDTDACTASCSAAFCGDGHVWAVMETCDDANMDDTDACTMGCNIAFCGDGYVRAGVEECDDANLDDTDACVPGCDLATCGDGHVWAGMETCDDGNMNDNDACTSLCTSATCGDGLLQAGVEECDDGNLDDDDECVAGCIDARCGDGHTWEGMEECDDGNRDDGDGCSATCTTETMGSTGDETGETGETGDPGDSGTGGSGGGSGGLDESSGDTGGLESTSDGAGDETTSSAGETAGGVDGSGCSCRSQPGGPTGTAGWWAMLGLLALGRRLRPVRGKPAPARLIP